MTDTQLITFLLPKVLVATLCGFIVGLEREIKNKVAGIRTHVLICVGAMLFVAFGYIGDQKVEASRIIPQIITGIGFLGAGVIFKNDDRVVGVTSAAFIWFISSIGVLIGMGFLITSFFLTIGLLALLLTLQLLENKIK